MNQSTKVWVMGISMGVLGLFLVGRKAVAGLKSTATVSISGTTTGSAEGSTGSARNSSNNTEYIGCQVVALDSGPWMSCYAKNSAGTFRSCMSSSSAYMANARALSGDVYIYFSWDSAGSCNNVTIDHASDNAPKVL